VLTAITRTVPSSSISIFAPDSSWMRFTTLPPGPMISRILSVGMVMVVTLGAYGEMSERDSAIV